MHHSKNMLNATHDNILNSQVNKNLYYKTTLKNHIFIK